MTRKDRKQTKKLKRNKSFRQKKRNYHFKKKDGYVPEPKEVRTAKKLAKFIIGNDPEINSKSIRLFNELVETVLKKGIIRNNIDEIRMARLLLENNIRDFEYSKVFETTKTIPKLNTNPETPQTPPEGEKVKNSRQVDFFFNRPIKILLFSGAIRAIEVKGDDLDKRCWLQKRELRDSVYNVQTAVVMRQHLNSFDKYGLTGSKIDPDQLLNPSWIEEPVDFLFNDFPKNEGMLIARMGEILTEHCIPFKYPKSDKWRGTYILLNEQGETVFWSDGSTQVFLIIDKNFISIDDLKKKRQFASRDQNAFMTLWQHIGYYEKYGFVREKLPSVLSANTAAKNIILP